MQCLQKGNIDIKNVHTGDNNHYCQPNAHIHTYTHQTLSCTPFEWVSLFGVRCSAQSNKFMLWNNSNSSNSNNETTTTTTINNNNCWRTLTPATLSKRICKPRYFESCVSANWSSVCVCKRGMLNCAHFFTRVEGSRLLSASSVITYCTCAMKERVKLLYDARCALHVRVCALCVSVPGGKARGRSCGWIIGGTKRACPHVREHEPFSWEEPR